MNKILKITAVNILLLVILFFIPDIFIYYRYMYMSNMYYPLDMNITYIQHITRKMNKSYIDEAMFSDNLYKEPLNVNSDKDAVILFGCSFVESADLKPDENLQYRMYEASGMPVYDRSRGGWGTQHMLYQASSDIFHGKLKNKPKYVVYTYISDHINRIHIAMDPVMYGGYPTFIYSENRKNQLVLKKFNEFIFRFPLTCYIKQTLFFMFSNQKGRADFLKKHIIQTANEFNKRYKDIEFIVLSYDFNNEIMEIADDLRKNNIKLFYYEVLTGRNPEDIELIISKDNNHPNARAWEILTPELWKYITNYNEEKEQKLKDFEKQHYQPQMEHGTMPFEEALTARLSVSDFSICFKDNILTEENKITKRQAAAAYTLWAFSDLLNSLKIKFLSEFLLKLAAKVNKHNEFYNQYYEKFKEING